MITRVTIRNYRGIEALEVEPGASGSVARGRCRSGKTSFLKAIRAALSAQDIGPDAIRTGADSAEILVDMDDLSVRRRITPKSSTLAVTKDEGRLKVSAAQTYLTELLGTSPIDPMDLLTLKAKERRQRILAALPVKVTVEQLRQWWPKCPDNFDVSGHGLEVVAALRAKCYERRALQNKAAKEARAEADRLSVLAAEAIKNAPESAPDTSAAIAAHDAARGKVAALRARQEESEKATARMSASRDRILDLRASAERKRAEMPELFDTIEAQKDRLAYQRTKIAELKRALAEEEAKESALVNSVAKMSESNMAREHLEREAIRLDEQASELESTISLATVAPVSAEELSAAVLAETDALASKNACIKAEQLAIESKERQNSATYAESKAQEAEAEAERLDKIVKALTDDAPKELLSTCDGIPGLALVGDDITLDGVSLDGLCGAEQIRFAVQIAKRANAKTKILVVDGLERLDPEAYDEFVREATADGWQLLASKVDRGAMVIDAISADAEVNEAAE